MDIGKWNEGVHLDHNSDRDASALATHHSDTQDGEYAKTEVDRDINVANISPDTKFEKNLDPVAPVSHSPPSSESLRLLDEIRNKNVNATRRLLDEGASLGVKDKDGHTVLGLAIRNEDASMIQLLIEKGADLEAADDEGCSPLYLAVQSSNIDMVELLLKFNPNVALLNAKTGKTAFHQAIEDGNESIAELLLDARADIDARCPDGQTALYIAVNSGSLDLVGFLLRHGANKKITLENGKTIEDIAEGDNAMIQLLQSSQLIEGPLTKNPTTNQEARYIYTPSPPADDFDKLHACQGFEATIVDFFVGDRERRLPVSSPIYDILYGKGPEAIMRSARGSKMNGQKAAFRWYHLPANNMEWVQILASRISAEHHSGSLNLDEDIKSKLALTNSPGRQYRATTAHSSFMRPLAQIVKPQTPSVNSSIVDGASHPAPHHVMLFMPYLHFETYGAYRRMSEVISNIRSSPSATGQQNNGIKAHEHPPPPPPPGGPGPRMLNARTNTNAIPRSDLESSDYDLSSRRSEPGILTPFRFIFHGYQKVQSVFQNLKTKARGLAMGQLQDLERGSLASDENVKVQPSKVMKMIPEEEAKSGEKVMNEATIKTLNETIDVSGQKRDSTSHDIGKDTSEPVLDGDPLPTASDTNAQGNEVKIDSETIDAPKSSANQEDGPINENSRQIMSSPSAQRHNSKRRKPRIPLANLDEHLLKAYLSPSKPGETPPLQLRRTLDQYYYTHLVSTAGRDGDQVVLRYTRKNSLEPKIFMVDQLWLWILNDDTIISCCPQRWDISGGIPSFHIPPPQPPFTMAGGLGAPIPTKLKHKHKEKSSGVLGWVAGSKKRRQPAQQRADGSLGTRSQNSNYDENHGSARKLWGPTEDANRKRRSFLKHDPLNVHQMILKYLQGSVRPPITSVQEMANLVVGICVNVFDQYRVPDEYQFFEFFERSIGAVIDQEAQCFKSFAVTLRNSSQPRQGLQPDSDSLFSITAETQLLGEIKDINDELNILQMVLNDQLHTLKEFARITKISNESVDNKDLESLAAVRVEYISSHLQKLAKMEKLAEKTYKSLNHLLDLKQKQANVSEALIARKQAEKTTAQAELAATHAEQGMGQAQLAYKQSIDTARQGRTLLLFTVITIIFLPLSFVAAFFAINIDAFPVNESGKLPLNYVMKYMFSISGAVSIPFILIAFNQDRIATWVKGHGKASAIWITIVIAAIILLSVVWVKSTVASGMKAALTAVIILAVVIGALAHLIYRLVSFANSRSSSSDNSGKSSVGSLADD